MPATLDATEPSAPLLPPPLLKVENLHKRFAIRKGFWNRHVGDIHALSGINLSIYPGETLGLVGESGCGKSTLGRCILQLLRPSQGNVWLQTHQQVSELGLQDLTQLSPRQLRPLRKQMQLIFQNPYSSLDPRMTIGDTLAEPMQIHKTHQGPALRARVAELLNWVGLPKDSISRYPHEFSGGQRQRIGIARAIALNPKLIVADEPVSALDVSVQAQILNLLEDLKQEFSLTYLFISHNLSVVEYVSNRIAVMYLGQIVELAPARTLYQTPRHPYTQALLSAIPLPDPAQKDRPRLTLEGDLPNPAHPPEGCRFHTRCPYVIERCRHEVPVLETFGASSAQEGNIIDIDAHQQAPHQVACHRAAELADGL